MSKIETNSIMGVSGEGSSPITLSGNTATLDSSVSVKTGTVLKQNPPLFFSAYITGNEEIPHATWSELGGSTSGINVVWAIQPTVGVSGASNANPFSKFDTTTGRFTPGRAGFYFFTYYCYFSEDFSDGKLLFSLCSKNGTTSAVSTATSTVCFTRQQNGTGITQL